MKLIFTCALAGVLVMVTGCDQVVNQVNQMASDKAPTLVFPPGFEIVIDHKPVFVSGFDDCPAPDKVMVTLFGGSQLDGSRNCIVLSKDKDFVSVRLASSSGVVSENWKIVRGVGKAGAFPNLATSLQRPDGSFVIPAR